MKTNFCFIVGTGRSGTHFLARTLNEHPKIMDPYSGNENKRVLMKTTNAAVRNMSQLPQVNIDHYKTTQLLNPNLVYLDQSHPNLFFISDIASKLNGARFVALWRETRAIVSSMLVHSGVRRWQQASHLYPFPNNFLGMIDREEYNSLSNVQKCALRVVEHKNEMVRVSNSFGSFVTIQNFEELILKPIETVNTLFDFLDLESLESLDIQPDPNVLDKWRTSLDEINIKEIEGIEGKFAKYELQRYEQPLRTSD